MDEKTCKHVPRRFHGTHVAGIAAGDGSETGNGQPAYQYVGVAPEANLLVVNHEDDVRDTQILDAVNWIMQTAGSSPVSINMSFGAHYGLHDGSYTLDQALNLLVGPGKAGKVISAAVGNEGNALIHAKTVLKKPVNDYSPYLRVWSPDDYSYALIQVWYPSNASVQSRLLIPKDEQSKQYVTTNWVAKNGRHVFEVNEGIFKGIFKGILVTLDGREAPCSANRNYNLITFILDKNNQNVNFAKFGFDLELNGPGTEIEAWLAFSPPGVAFERYPDDELQIQPDSECTISTPASAANVIGTASYVTKKQWITVDGNEHNDSSAIIGSIAESSGRGPLHNGTRKPDLAAPGQYIVAAWQSNIQPDYGTRRSQSVPDGKHFIDQGTSMASPHVCGAAALLLQKNPRLDADQIKQLLISSAHNENPAGWDGRWGAGKMDIKPAWDAAPVPSEIPTPGVTPVVPSPTQSPLPQNSIRPLLVYEFNQNGIAGNGWAEIPGGFTHAAAGSAVTTSIPDLLFPSSKDKQGISVQVQDKQVVFLYAQTPVQTNGVPMLIRALVKANRPEVSITLAALKGNLQSSLGVDGSIATYMPATAKGYLNKERFLTLLYKPDGGNQFTPIIQVAAADHAPSVQVWIDKLEIYELANTAINYPGYLFYSNWFAQGQPQATVTPFSPSPLPTWTPTLFVQPSFTPTWTPTSIPVPSPISTPTGISSGEWIVLGSDPSGDARNPSYDIKQLLIRLSGTDVTFRMVTNKPWANENTRKSQSTFEIALDTDNNKSTGDPFTGADYLLTAGIDFLTDEYRESICQWSDPDKLGFYDFYQIKNLQRIESPDLNTLDITISLADIGNPVSVQIFSSIFDQETFDKDVCPDVGSISYPR